MKILRKIKARKPKQANWGNCKISLLINAKKIENHASLEVVDFQNNMESSITKWKCI
jgi:hypothetical protein